MAANRPERISLENVVLRIGLYGPTFGGKTHFLMGVPGIAVIDLEAAVDRAAKRFPGGLKIPINSVEDVRDSVRAVLAQEKGFEVGALGIDSITAYRRMLQAADGRAKQQYKDSDVNKVISALLARLFNGVPIPVCVTAHEKPAFTDNEKALPNDGGMIPDSDPRFFYPFDIVARQKKMNGKHGAVVVKSRFGDLIPVGTFIPNFSYAYILEKLGLAAPAAAAGATQPAAGSTAAAPPAAARAASQTAPAGGTVTPIGNALTPEEQQRLDKLAARYAKAGSPNGKFSEYLRVHGHPTRSKELASNLALCQQIFAALEPKQQAS